MSTIDITAVQPTLGRPHHARPVAAQPVARPAEETGIGDFYIGSTKIESSPAQMSTPNLHLGQGK